MRGGQRPFGFFSENSLLYSFFGYILQYDFPKMRGVKGRLEFSRKFIRFGTVTRPSAIMKLENEVQKIYSIGD